MQARHLCYRASYTRGQCAYTFQLVARKRKATNSKVCFINLQLADMSCVHVSGLYFSNPRPPAEHPERSVQYRECVRRVSRVGVYLCWVTRARTRWTSRCTCWTPARTASSWCFLRPCGASSCSSPRSCPSAPWGSAAAPRAPAGTAAGRAISQSISGLCMHTQKFPSVPFTCNWVCSQQTMQTSRGRGVATRLSSRASLAKRRSPIHHFHLVLNCVFCSSYKTI